MYHKYTRTYRQKCRYYVREREDLETLREHGFSPYLEQLNSDDGKHKLQEECDKHDVSDGLHSNNNTLNHMLNK